MTRRLLLVVAGALVAARQGGFDLAEGSKRQCDVALGHADAGVADDESEATLIEPGFEAHRSAGRGELDGVGQQVKQGLAQPDLVGQRRDAVLDEVGTIGQHAQREAT